MSRRGGSGECGGEGTFHMLLMVVTVIATIVALHFRFIKFTKEVVPIMNIGNIMYRIGLRC